MMPDLGKYGTEVTSAYVVSVVLLLVLVWLSLRRARRVRRDLEQQENKAGRNA
ncbi:heme exporter protein CcmD [Brevirhabdus sp.]|uniref:heme exporter protein CcmD n=1 Tax=Brevirhabdus sp. TaxID=2004514 RepID=UPI004058DA32